MSSLPSSFKGVTTRANKHFHFPVRARDGVASVGKAESETGGAEGEIRTPEALSPAALKAAALTDLGYLSNDAPKGHGPDKRFGGDEG
jgi:hypothetical protein